MDEATWLTCTAPQELLAFLLRRRARARKLRLFAVACCRRVWHRMPDRRCRDAVETVERFADGAATRTDLSAAYEPARTVYVRSGANYALAVCAALGERCDAANAAAYAARPGPRSESHIARRTCGPCRRRRRRGTAAGPACRRRSTPRPSPGSACGSSTRSAAPCAGSTVPARRSGPAAAASPRSKPPRRPPSGAPWRHRTGWTPPAADTPASRRRGPCRRARPGPGPRTAREGTSPCPGGCAACRRSRRSPPCWSTRPGSGARMARAPQRRSLQRRSAPRSPCGTCRRRPRGTGPGRRGRAPCRGPRGAGRGRPARPCAGRR
jgi:hypothetical protein